MRIFLEQRDYALYRELLRRVVRGWGWRCLAYCLMPNHVHLVVETEIPNLGEGMQRLQSLYAQMFNLTNARSGHLFQGRFGAVAIRDERQLATTVSYVLNNPVDAGLAEAAEAWPWSGQMLESAPTDAAPTDALLGSG
jgi:REP element-mobilizing transposase RayT